MNKKRLQKLADHLRTVPPEKLNMDEWNCGSASCAVGHACSIPEFAAEGLSLELSFFGNLIPFFDGLENWAAVHDFFDLSEDEAQELFGSDAYQDHVTPSEVSAAIEYFIANGDSA